MDLVPVPPQLTPQTTAQVASDISVSSIFLCPQCHFAVKPEYYYCPNCGKNLRAAALPTDTLSQFLLYGFSIVLPFIAYLAITKWQGIKYIRSEDPKAKQMGYIALIILIVSSIFVIWWTTVQIEGYIQSSVTDFNTNFSGL